MAGHGSPPPPDRGNHPGRRVDRVSLGTGEEWPKKRAAQVAQIRKNRSGPAFRYSQSENAKRTQGLYAAAMPHIEEARPEGGGGRGWLRGRP